MKLRIKFSKQGYVKFIGHLDVMRYFQKAIRRAGLPVRYSEGFSPHMIMSFAAPLGVGLLSNGEYMDIELSENPGLSSNAIRNMLNNTMAEGFQILQVKELPDQAKNAMSIVAAADYRVFLTGNEIDWTVLSKTFEHFCQQPSIMITKVSKKSEREVDLRPLLYEVRLEEETKSIFMKLSTGSTNNLKPELVMEAFCNTEGIDLEHLPFIVEREEVYGFTSKEMTDYIPLEEFGTDFPGKECIE